jgi:hypothetical protein
MRLPMIDLGSGLTADSGATAPFVAVCRSACADSTAKARAKGGRVLKNHGRGRDSARARLSSLASDLCPVPAVSLSSVGVAA